MASNATNVTCISLEANRGSEIYRITALVVMIATGFVISSGAVLWWHQRKSVWLRRRNPGIVWLLVISIISTIFSGTLYRFYLNDPDKIFEDCTFVSFFFLLSVPSFIIPNTARIISFHYRQKLHKNLSHLHKIYSDGDDTGAVEAITKPSSNPVFFRAQIKNSGLVTIDSQPFDSAEVKRIKKLRFQAGSKYAFNIALGLLGLSAICASIYAIISCRIFFDDRSDCEYGSTGGNNLILLLTPVIPVVVLYVYFRMRILKTTPDPFGIKAEIDIFMWLVLTGVIISILNFVDPTNFQKAEEKSDEDINFKWIELIDIVALMGFINSVHWQVYKAVRFKNSIKLAYPMNLQEILDHAVGCELYKVFLESDFSVENLVLYNLISQWKKRYNHFESVESRDKEAKRNIFKKWLDTSGGTGVGMNISAGSLSNLSLIFKEEQEYSISIFDEVQDELFALMEQDSFLRFINTSEYKIFVGVRDPQDISNIT